MQCISARNRRDTSTIVAAVGLFSVVTTDVKSHAVLPAKFGSANARVVAQTRLSVLIALTVPLWQFLVGERRGPFAPPALLDLETFDRLKTWAGDAATALEAAYVRDENSVPPQMVYRTDRSVMQILSTDNEVHFSYVSLAVGADSNIKEY